MKILCMALLILFCSLSLGAQTMVQAVSLEWSRLEAAEGDRFMGRVVISGPAPEGGLQVILEPTFKLEMPTTLRVPAGHTTVDFPVKIIDNRFIERDRVSTFVTVCIRGQQMEFPGPIVTGD